jgi:hypothetical protein
MRGEKLRVGVTFENYDRSPIDDVGVEELVQGAIYWLEGSDCKKIRSSIPGNIMKGMKFRRYLRNRDIDNVGIQCYQKCTKEQAGYDNG